MVEQDFDTFFKMHERRIHFQIHRLGISGGWYSEFYTEGSFALWQAYKDFNQQKGNLGTYLNYRIRYKLIDLVRKKTREIEQADKLVEHRMITMTNGTRNRNTDTPLVDIPSITIQDRQFWQNIRNQLTENQWKWVHYFIIADLSIQEIMEIENVTADAVKGWGQSVRKKLRNDEVKEALEDILKK